ncbi:MAG: DUF4476 domain-containing protein [Ignavibacteria bacterium]|nr:DUF4476 domain-containing protein [Ignavibacteria bacterium]
MKKYFLIICFIFTSSVFYSQNSYLQISLYDDEMFSVILDNTQFSDGNYAEFDMLSPGEHILKVIKSGIDQSPQGNVVFEGKIKIPAGYDLYSVIDEYNAFYVYKKKKYGFNRIYPSGEGVKKCGDNGNTVTKKEEFTVNDECRYKIMKKEDFNDLKSSVSNRSFESSNIAVLKTAIDKNYLSSEQLRELLNYFTFEDSKLEIAKYAYKKVCDQKNFFKVYDAFDFDSSITELKNYISGK